MENSFHQLSLHEFSPAMGLLHFSIGWEGVVFPFLAAQLVSMMGAEEGQGAPSLLRQPAHLPAWTSM